MKTPLPIVELRLHHEWLSPLNRLATWEHTGGRIPNLLDLAARYAASGALEREEKRLLEKIDPISLGGNTRLDYERRLYGGRGFEYPHDAAVRRIAAAIFAQNPCVRMQQFEWLWKTVSDGDPTYHLLLLDPPETMFPLLIEGAMTGKGRAVEYFWFWIFSKFGSKRLFDQVVPS